MLERYGNNPQRIEMDCTSVYQSLTRQMVESEAGFQDLPASEDNLALREAVQNAARGIRATHPDIAENRRILVDQALRELTDEQLAELRDAEPVLEAISDEALGREFKEDVLYLTEEMRREPPRTLEAGERNPVLAGYDEKVRIFNGAAGIAILLQKYTAILDKVSELSGLTRSEIIATVFGLVGLGTALLR